MYFHFLGVWGNVSFFFVGIVLPSKDPRDPNESNKQMKCKDNGIGYFFLKVTSSVRIYSEVGYVIVMIMSCLDHLTIKKQE